MNWQLDYLGKPWLVGAHGPDSFDCWGLLADIYQKQKGIILPRYSELDKLDRKQVISEIKSSIGDEWERLEKPVDLCAVGLSNLSNRIFHVGCYIEKDSGYVIHTQKNVGCMIEPIAKIMQNFKHVSFYGLRQYNQQSL